jgi:nucleotide-binding universal stress UspA family protein
MTSVQQVVDQVRPPGGVVVGDDGSPGAALAVEYAVGEAQRRHTTLHVVHAWTIVTAATPASERPGYVPPLQDFEAATLVEERGRVEQLVGTDPGVPVQVHVVHGAPARVLIDASATADVVVVGTRGLGGFASLVLGSVADQCIRHCAGPVVVVR